MRSPYSNGTIRQQENANRNHARQVITRMLAVEAIRAAVMVDYLTQRIRERTVEPASADAIWTSILNSVQLATVRRTADENVADYPEFSGWVNGQRTQIEKTQKSRLREFLNPIETQRRFGNSVRLQKLHLVTPA